MFDSLDHRFTKFLLESNALKFGDFTLKSGRRSPYFINAGAFDDGKKIATLGGFYAEKIQTEIDNEQLPIRHRYRGGTNRSAPAGGVSHFTTY